MLGKLIRRSARSVRRLTVNTADRLDAAQAALAVGTYDANHLARDVAGQILDTLNVWLETWPTADEKTTPSVLLELIVSGRGTSKVSAATTATLREPIASIALLQGTELSGPRGIIAAKHVELTNVDSTAQVEVLKINVTVPNNQKQGLYHGLITIGSVVLVEVRAWVHI